MYSTRERLDEITYVLHDLGKAWRSTPELTLSELITALVRLAQMDTYIGAGDSDWEIMCDEYWLTHDEE